MAKYKYTAKCEKEGVNVQGEITASDKRELSRILKKKHRFLISCEEIDYSKKDKKELFLFKKIAINNKIAFIKNLKILLSGGLSFSRALDILADQAGSKYFKIVIIDIKEEILKGKNFSQALEKYPHIFSNIMQSMVSIAEESGTLERTLDTIVSQLEKEKDMKSKIKAALIYPSIIISAMILLGFVFLIVFIPQLIEVFNDLGAELPIMTKFVFGVSTFLANYWHIVFLGFSVFVVIVAKAAKVERGKKIIDAVMLRLPVISNLVKKNNIAYINRTLASLLSSGVSLNKSIEIISDSISNYYFAKSIKESITLIERGETLSTALMPYPHLYDNLTVQMIEVGEETGKTTDMLVSLSEFHEEEVIAITKNLSVVIEPVMMMLIGIAIGFFALAVIMPIYSMLDFVE